MEEINHRGVNRAQRGRIKLVKLLAAIGVVSASSQVPAIWKQPVIGTVLLPAHAQTSPGSVSDGPRPTAPPGFIVSVDPLFSCNSAVLFEQNVFALISVSPAPQSDKELAINIDCDGQATNLVLVLDSAGTANLTIDARNLCAQVFPDQDVSTFTSLVLTASYKGVSESCSWEFETVAEVQPD